jgi:hypothetical protein
MYVTRIDNIVIVNNKKVTCRQEFLALSNYEKEAVSKFRRNEKPNKKRFKM